MPVTLLQSAGDRAAKRRRRVGYAFTRLHAAHERDALRRLAPFYRHVIAAVMARVKAAGKVGFTVDDVFRWEWFVEPFHRVMRPVWNGGLSAGIGFEADTSGGKRQSLWLPGAIRQDAPSIHVDLSHEMQARIREYLREREAGVWDSVSSTMHDRLRRAIQRGLKNGESFDDMQDRIQATMMGLSDYQARRIARSETTGSMNFGQQVEREELGISHKEWVSTLDTRNRGADPNSPFDHLTCDGQTVRNADPFTISGQRMRHPGDGSLGASAGNIIQCRCTAVGAWVEERPRRSPRPSLMPLEEVTPVSTDFRAEVRRGMQSIPNSVRKLFKENGVRVSGGRRLSSIDPSLVGQVPRGHLPGITFDHLPGVLLDGERIAIAEFHLGHAGQELRTADPAGVFRHEAGHALDMLLSASQEEKFTKAYHRDIAAIEGISDPELRRAIQMELEYLLQPGEAGAEEAFAAGFAILHGGSAAPWIEPQIRKWFARSIKAIQAYLRKLPR